MVLHRGRGAGSGMEGGEVMTDEEAKAVQEAAKALQEVTRTARDIGRNAAPFVARVFGPLVENAVGILSGKLAYYRLENFFDLAEKTELLLAKRGVSDPRSVPVPFALPLIEAATMEGNDRMRDRWASRRRLRPGFWDIPNLTRW